METSGGSGQNRYGVVQFAGTNYRNWAYRVRIVLEELEVDSVLSEERKEDKAWKAKDAKGKSVIVACIADSHLEYVKGCETSKEMMEKLRSTFEKTGLSAQVAARRKLIQLKVDEKTSLAKFFNKFDKAIADLKLAGAEPDSVELVSTLLAAMPASYDGVAGDIEASAGSLNSVTLDIAKKKLLNEERRKKEAKPQQKVNGTSNEQKPKTENSKDQQNRNKPVKKNFDDRNANNQNKPKLPVDNYMRGLPWNPYAPPINNPNLVCHLCAKPGHLKPQCPNNWKNRTGPGVMNRGFEPPRQMVGRGRGIPLFDP